MPQTATLQTRDYRFDNVKALIMLGIVATHLIEPAAKGKLYSFMVMMHMYDMPTFCFISGRFASFKPKRMLEKLVFPYLVFQTLYLLFANFVLKSPHVYQYHQPYWLMWYMMAMIEWSLTVPLLKRIKGNWRWVYVGATIVLALLVGYVGQIYYDWNLGRMFYFYPCFAAGYFTRPYSLRPNKKWITALFGVGTLCILFALYSGMFTVHVEWWYGSVPYSNEAANYTPLHKIIMYCIAFVIGGFIMTAMPSKQYNWTYIGVNLTPIYFCHGFIIKLLTLWNIYANMPYQLERFVFCEITSILLLLALGSEPVVKLVTPLMSWPFHFKKAAKEPAKTA